MTFLFPFLSPILSQIGDPYFASVLLLLHAEGTDGSTTFTDSSAYARVGTAADGAKLTTAQSKFGSSSIVLDGNGDYINFPASTDWALPGDFTLELWYRPNGSVTKNDFVLCNTASSGFFVIVGASNLYLYYADGSTILVSGAVTWTASAWHHIAVARSGSTCKLFVNGAQVGSATVTTSFGGGSIFRIGNAATYSPNACIDEVRITKGVARYTAAFTSPIAPFPDLQDAQDGYTKLLLHFDGANGSTTFVDQSFEPKAITAYGNAQIDTSQSKFGGACGLFDGSGDYLVAPPGPDFNFGANDFTAEMFVRSTQTTRADILTQNTVYTATGWWGLLFNVSGSGTIALYETSSARISATGTNWNDGSWHHIALTRAGNVMRLFVDGVQVGSSYTTSFSYGTATDGLTIGAAVSGGQAYSGRLDELRISKGIARWTSAFTPPSAPY